MMNETECLICNCNISEDYKPKIIIAQSCNCIYKVHDECIQEWCREYKSKCLICHKPIKPCSTLNDDSTRNHEPFKNVEMPPRMSFFHRLFRCCIY